MIDIHCHLTFPGLDEIKEKVILEAKKSMVAIINCGLSNYFEKTLEISKNHPKFVYSTLGIHPEDIVKMKDEEIERELEFIRENANKIVAIGEIGLDYFWVKDKEQNEKCKEIFIRCLEIAKERKLPVVLHSRNAEEDVFKIVKKNGIENAVFHHYSGNISLAKQIIDDGYCISIPTIIGTSKNHKKIVKNFSLDKLMTETDSPFLGPVKAERNEPAFVKNSVTKIAELKQMEILEVENNLFMNFQKLI